MNDGRKNSTEQQVREYILERIGTGAYQPGAKIATVRELTSRLKVSHVTAATALRNLAREGILESRVGAGTFVRATLPEGAIPPRRRDAGCAKTLHFFFTHGIGGGLDSYHAEVLCALQQETAARGWMLKINLLNPADYQAVRDDLSAIGVIHGSAPEFRPLPELAVPVIQYGMSPGPGCRCCVTPDNYAAGVAAANLLREHGFSSARFITAAAMGWNLHFAERERGFADGCTACGIGCEPTLAWAIRGQAVEDVTALLRELAASPSAAPVALAVGNRAMALEIAQTAASLGVAIPRPLSIVTFICRGGQEKLVALDTFDFNCAQMARTCLGLLDDALAGYELPSRVLLPMHLLAEGSLL